MRAQCQGTSVWEALSVSSHLGISKNLLWTESAPHFCEPDVRGFHKQKRRELSVLTSRGRGWESQSTSQMRNSGGQVVSHPVTPGKGFSRGPPYASVLAVWTQKECFTLRDGNTFTQSVNSVIKCYSS